LFTKRIFSLRDVRFSSLHQTVGLTVEQTSLSYTVLQLINQLFAQLYTEIFNLSSAFLQKVHALIHGTHLGVQQPGLMRFILIVNQSKFCFIQTVTLRVILLTDRKTKEAKDILPFRGVIPLMAV